MFHIYSYANLNDATKDAYYYAAINATYGTNTNDASDEFVLSYVRGVAYGSTTAANSLTEAYIDAYVDGVATAVLESLVKGKTPYTFQSDPLGYPRTSTSNTDEVLLAAVSETCYNWDEGLVLPEVYHIMTMGGTKPNSQDEVSSSSPYSRVKATQSIYYFLHQDKIKTRLASGERPGGDIIVSTSDAEEILYRFKKKFENTFSQGWNNDKSGDIQFTAFTDGKTTSFKLSYI